MVVGFTPVSVRNDVVTEAAVKVAGTHSWKSHTPTAATGRLAVNVPIDEVVPDETVDHEEAPVALRCTCTLRAATPAPVFTVTALVTFAPTVTVDADVNHPDTPVAAPVLLVIARAAVVASPAVPVAGTDRR